MINLLPYDTKQQIRAAHFNVTLVKYIILLSIAVAFLVLACAVTYLFLSNNQANNDKPAVNNNSKLTTDAGIQNQVNTFRTNLTTVKTILDQQVSYSDILMGIAAALPPETTLDSIALNDSSFGAPMALQVHARSADSEPKLKENFQKSSVLFSDYKLGSISTDNAKSSDYPVTISISLTIKKVVAQ